MIETSLSQAIKFCFEREVTFEQFLFMFLLRKVKEDKGKLINEYVEKFEVFSIKGVINPLEKKGYIENMNSPGKYYPDMFLLTPKADKVIATHDMGAQMWYAYPGMMPISNGKLFISRGGISFDDFIRLYLEAIDYSTGVHEMVMRRIPIFIKMVEDGVLNGKKIVDFVRERVWEVIPEDNEETNWGKDV